MMSAELRYAPEFALALGEEAAPAALRSSISEMSFASGLEMADRVEFAIYDPELRWLADPRLALGAPLALELGYAPAPLTQVFVGEVCTVSSSFPSTGAATVTVAAQDVRYAMQRSPKTRWFAVSSGSGPSRPLLDVEVASIVSAGHRLIPIFDPVSAGVSLLLGGVEQAVALREDEDVQKLIRRQDGQSDFDFLTQIAAENGWSVLVDHSGQGGGQKLRFSSLAANVDPVAKFEYGRNLLSFAPRRTNVGQVARVSTSFWVPSIKTKFRASVGYDIDTNELQLELTPSFGEEASDTDGRAELELAGKPANQYDAPRKLVAELLGRLNKRLTAAATVVGDTALVAGQVVEIAEVGPFSGRYRITEAQHSMGSAGYQTSLSLRSEIWFDAPSLAAPTPRLGL